FFQAEDGIRDRTVTGVQTCALPISSGRSADIPVRCNTRTQFRLRQNPRVCVLPNIAGNVRAPEKRGGAFPNRAMAAPLVVVPPRSEERRVGKECILQWWWDGCRSKR